LLIEKSENERKFSGFFEIYKEERKKTFFYFLFVDCLTELGEKKGFSRSD